MIDNEINRFGIDPANIFLAGFAEGGRLVFNVGFGQLPYSIGGYFTIGAYPLYPVLQETKDEIVYSSPDMNWFFFIGEDDRTYYTGTLWRI